MRILTVLLALSTFACQVRGQTGPRGEAGADGVVVEVPSDRPNYESGSRLTAQHFAGSDGSVAFSGFWDSERSERCDFTFVGEGRNSCLPQSSVPLFLSSGGKMFSDNECTAQLAVEDRTIPFRRGTITSYVFIYSETAASSLSVYRVNHQYRGELFALGSMGCESVGPANGSNHAGSNFYNIGEEVPLSSFVSAEVL